MAEAGTMLLQDNNIRDFLKILHGSNMGPVANEYADFFGSIDAMQTQLNETLAELKSVRKQLNAMEDKRNPIKKALTTALNKLQAELQAIQKQLNALKEKLITAAKNAVQSFKEKGQAALNGVLQFFDVKQELQATVMSTASVIKSCNQSIAKIEKVSNEYHAAALHTRNMGRAAAGKEAVSDQKQNGKLARALQAIIRIRRKISRGLKKTCETALKKLDVLEKTVQLNRGRVTQRKAARKPSLLGRMGEHQKTTVREQAAPGKSQKREEVL